METENKTTTYAGFIAIVGRPNVGKSPLLNKMLGQKVSITSRKPQTTRFRIMGIDTHENYQTVYVDTPGLHAEEPKAINRLMNRSAESSLSDVQLVLFVVEGTHWQEDDELTLSKIKRSGLPTVLVINKVDKFSGKEVLLPFIEHMTKLHDFKDIIPVSAVQGTNVEQLKEIVRSYLPESEFIFPDDYVTDRPVRFMVSEIIREKLMRLTGDELPYAVTVEIESFRDEQKMVRIAAAILVDKPNQKKMIIGSEGSKIKQVGTDARKDIEELLGKKVFLELWVKVKKGWADDERALKSLGYMDKDGFD